MTMIEMIHPSSMASFIRVMNSSRRNANGNTASARNPHRTKRGYRRQNRIARRWVSSGNSSAICCAASVNRNGSTVPLLCSVIIRSVSAKRLSNRRLRFNASLRTTRPMNSAAGRYQNSESMSVQ